LSNIKKSVGYVLSNSFFLFFNFGIKSENLKLASTLVFATLGAVDLVYVISFKNLRRPINKTENFFENKFLPLTILYGFFILFLAIYFSPLQKILNTVPLKISHWGIVFSVGILATILLELLKFVFANKKENN
jgi:magnesium-transporting ATPase (P-type)